MQIPYYLPETIKEKIQSTDSVWSMEMNNWALIQKNKRTRKKNDIMDERGRTKEHVEMYGLKFRQKQRRPISRFGRSDLISMENIMMVSSVFSPQAERHPCREIWFQDLASGQQGRAIKGSLAFPAITLVVAVEELPG